MSTLFVRWFLATAWKLRYSYFDSKCPTFRAIVTFKKTFPKYVDFDTWSAYLNTENTPGDGGAQGRLSDHELITIALGRFVSKFCDLS